VIYDPTWLSDVVLSVLLSLVALAGLFALLVAAAWTIGEWALGNRRHASGTRQDRPQ
jgi:hypothetical protein